MRIVGPDEAVNTYSLMEAAALGLVFGSTAGLEMPMRGLPVVMPVPAHYAQKGFTTDAFTEPAYFAAIEGLLANGRPTLGQDLIDRAWCYFDVYSHAWPRPIPWMLPTLENDMREWPLKRVLGPEGLEKFGATFRALLGEGE